MADPGRAVAELVNWAEQLRLDATDTSDRAKANALIGCIHGRAHALVVLDNIEDPDILNRDLPGLMNSRPRGLGCKLLITSRQQVPDWTVADGSDADPKKTRPSPRGRITLAPETPPLRHLLPSYPAPRRCGRQRHRLRTPVLDRGHRHSGL